MLQHTQKYNPQIHHRRSIRLKGYDYSQAGAYFITMCCHHRKHRFGKIIDGEMVLNELGVIAQDQWVQLTERFTNIELDAFQIMPNHMHGIIVINVPNVVSVGATLAVAPIAPDGTSDHDDRAGASPTPTTGASPAPTTGASPAPTIGDIVGAYKSLVAHTYLNLLKTINKTMGQLWQRNYYEHIIRNEKAYQNISSYIINNPKNWLEDRFYV